jgi:type IV pilus assembly protein PilV
MQWKEQDGFTLLEVLIAISLLAIGVLSALTVETACIRGNSMAARMDDATGLAQITLERLRSVADPTKLKKNVTTALTATGDVGGPYTLTTAITPHASVARARWVEVSVSWTDGFGNHQVELQGLATGGGP